MRHRPIPSAAVCAVLALAACAGSARAQFPPDSFTNLQVLPQDIAAGELVRMMAGFTRALGVRCTHCHVGEESQPLADYDFATDEKPAKRKARAMIEMLGRINGEHLGALAVRADPPVRVECITCHRGVREPRMLQEILLAAYAAAGVDSVMSAYQGLRTRYYGRFTYDFSEVPLADVAGEVGRTTERMGDAERLHALNVEMNPASAFAKRGHAASALFNAFTEGPPAGRARLTGLSGSYGDELFGEVFMNQLGYDLLRRGRTAAAVDVFRLNTERHPTSSNVWDSLAEGLAEAGEGAEAIRAAERAVELDPANAAARERLRRLRGG